jgi:Acetoacetate decarboxylase (ADC)
MASIADHIARSDRMALTGFTPPYTPTGRSSLADAPPWHYAGQILSLAFEVERTTAQALLPERFGTATGRAYGHFCEWQACTDHGRELVDPVYAQYKEFFVLIEAESGLVAGAALYCPFIYVDQDISMARGWMQGWPKKMGSVWMTRSYPGLDRPAAAPIRSGTRFGASLAVKDRRLAEAAVTLTGEEALPIGFLAMPTFGLVGSPTLIGAPCAGSRTLVRGTVPDKMQGPAHAASLSALAFFASPRDELSLLAPKALREASLSTFGLTVAGATAAEAIAP